MKHIYLFLAFLFIGVIAKAQEFDLSHSGGAIAPTMTIGMGSVNIGSFSDKIFTITNSSTSANLTVTTPITLVQAGTDFSCISQPATTIASSSGSTTFTIRFQPVTPAGSKAVEITINNNESPGPENPFVFTISATAVAAATPTVTTTGTLTAFSACSGTASTQQSFTVSGSNLTANVIVTPPTGFEVSTTSGSGFASSVTLTQSGGTVSSTTIYARLTNAASGTPSGNITCASTGATTQNVAASGTVNALPTITLGSVTGVNTSATTFSLPYSATTGSPNQYSIVTGSPTAMPSFVAVTNASLPASPISVTIPASAANTYNFVATVRNSTTGCTSANNNFALTVAASNNADLSAMTISSGTLTPTFASATTSYTASVTNGTSSITVTPTRSQANATIQARVNGGTYASVTSGSPSGSLSLNVGSNTIDVLVTAQDGTTTKTYTTTVTRAGSNNADLSAMTISSGTLTPTFASATTSYTASVTNATTSITVTPTRSEANATIQVRVNGGSYASVTSGSASGSLSLNVGSNTIDVLVTAQDGTTTKTYTTTVTRAGSNTTEFNYTGAVQTYTVPAGVTQIAVTLKGASGGNATWGTATGGKGAFVQATINVTPGSTINVYVGGQAGWNGGGAAGNAATTRGGRGGDASDIRIGGTALTDRILVAGGGGGAGGGGSASSNVLSGNGGNGGNSNTASTAGANYDFGTGGITIGGQGGTVGTGGAQGTGCVPAAGTAGANTGAGGNGRTVLTPANNPSGGGGGGGFVNGGGGGGGTAGTTVCTFNSNNAGGGGAGGSSFTGTATFVTIAEGDNMGNGAITITPVLGISAATYDITTGILIVSGAGLTANAGTNNDIDVSKLTITGQAGATYTLTSPNVDITNSSSFTVTLNTTDKNALISLLNKNGTSSDGGTTYNIAAASDWLASTAGIPDLTGNGITVSNVATITPTGTLSALSGCIGTASSSQTFTVSGAALTADISLTAPTGYEISLSSGSGYGSSLNITQSGGTVTTTTIYVRLAATATGTPSGNIAATSTNAITQNVAASATVNALPTITLGSNPAICNGITSANLTYSATTASPNQYSIVWDAASITAGFNNVTNTSLPSTPIVITVPANPGAGNYAGTLTVRNSTTGCTSTSSAVSVTVNPLPTISLGSIANVSPSSTTFSIPYTATTGSPNQYSITTGSPTAMPSFSAVTNASLPASPISVTIPASAANTYNFVASVRNSATGCSSTNNNFTVAVVAGTAISSIAKGTPSGTKTNANSVTYNINFGASVTGLSASNFTLTTSGVSGASIGTLSGSGANYTLTVNTGTGNGSITLNLDNATGISPAITTTLPFAGETYTIDKTNPTVVTQNRTVYLSAAGTGTVSATQVNNGSNDASGIASLGLSQTSFTCANVGTPVTVTLTASDSAGNSNTGTATITVLDTVRPVVVTQNRTVYLSAAGTATVSALQLNNGTSDACGVASLSASQTSYTCANVGTPVTVTLTATDLNGNTNTGTATVTVLDTVRPVVVTQNRTVYLSAAGTATVSALQLNNGTSDACGVASLSASQTSYTCANVGTPVTVTLTATDLNGNTNTGTATVTVLDTVRPIVNTQNRTVYLSAAGTATVSALQLNNGTSDACGVASLSASQTSYTCANVGTPVTVTLTATDLNGNTNTGTATVTVLDTVRPVVNTQNRTVYLSVAGTATVSALQLNNGTSDACGVASLSASQTSYTCANVGTPVTVTLTATDLNGNTNTGTATVTVLDTVRPVVVTQNRTVYLSAAGTATVSALQLNNGTSDACGVASLSASQTSYTCANVGTPVTVTLTATDLNGNTNTGTATVTVLDTARPVVVTQNRTVYLSAAGTATVSALQLNNGTSDACGVASLSASQTSYTCANVGTPVTVTLTATDLNGNTNTGTATVTVLDTVRPVVVTQNRTVYLNAAGTATVSAGQVNNGSTDACGVAALNLSQTSFTCANVGTPVTVTLTVTDVNSNSRTGTATITVLDTVRPIVNTQNRTVYLSAAGTATVSALQLNNGTSDACGVASLSASQTSYTCANVGTPVTVTLTATDLNGNTNTGTATVTVLDTVRPVVVTQNRTVYLNAAGTATVSALQLNNGTSDACGVASLSASQTSYTCANVGTPVTVTLTATDLNGNTNTGTANVTVLDTIKPIIVCKADTAILLANGTVTITPDSVTASATDNCSITSRALSKTTFNVANVGNNSVTLTITDASGNISTCVTNVYVVEPKPNAICQNATIYLNASGTATLNVNQIDNGSNSLVGIATRTLSKTTYNCTNLGANTVKLTVTNTFNASDSCTATVTVLDTIKPMASAQDISVYLNASGTVALTPAELNTGSIDNCVIDSITASKTSFTCANLGVNQVWLRVKDKSGNVDSASVNVIVSDPIAPIARPKAKVIVYLSNNGQAVINPSLIDSASTDNCTITSRILSQTVFSCGQIGNNTITFTVQDQSGNSTFANSIVEVRDTIKPNVIVSNQTLYLNASGTASLTAVQANNNSTDNCGIDSVWLSKTNFNCSNIGNNNVNLFVRDVNGNTNSANVTVALFDTIRPVLRSKQNIRVFLTASGTGTLNINMVDSNSSDNCTLGGLSLSQASFDCSNLGNNVVTLSGADASNNNNSINVNILVRDTIKPSLTTSNVTVYLNASGITTLSGSNVVSSSGDNCVNPTIGLSKTSFTCAERGNNNVTVTATDASGNSVTNTAVVTVLDSMRPTPVAQNLTIYLNASGNASITAVQANNGSSDNCGITGLSLNKTTFNGTNLGLNTVTLTATDASSNSNSVNFTVTVLDTVRPVVVTQNITTYLNASGVATISAAQVNNGSSDNVGINTVSLSKPTFTCSDLGNNAVVLSVTDASNNTTTGVATVTVLDTIRPVAVAQNITVYLNGIGQAIITPGQVNNGSSDNCGVSSTTLSKTTFSCANTGANTVTLLAMDASGNTSNTLITVTVLDTTKPNVVVNNNLNLYLNTSGTIGLTTTQVNNGSSDNCSITGFVLSKTAFNGTNLGLNQVNFTATDASGNSHTVMINVTIIDTIRPLVQTQNKIVYLNNNGQASVTTSEINNGSTDNVAVSGIELNKSTFNCSDLGINTIRLSVEDLSGNIGNGNS